MKKWIKPLLVAVIIFPLSIFMDIIMGREFNYPFAFLLSIIFGITFFLLQIVVSYFPLGKKRT